MLLYVCVCVCALFQKGQSPLAYASSTRQSHIVSLLQKENVPVMVSKNLVFLAPLMVCKDLLFLATVMYVKILATVTYVKIFLAPKYAIT